MTSQWPAASITRVSRFECVSEGGEEGNDWERERE